MTKHFFGLTDTGKTRDNNEDSFIAESFAKNLVLAAVIDGVGGYHGGEVAAEIAREQILKKFSKQPSAIIPQMIEAFKEANKEILARKQKEKELAEMACVATLVVTDIENNQFYYAHVGDTRLYLFRDGSLVKISKDHSFVGFLEDSGRLNEIAAMKHPKRNEINKAIGFSDDIDTDESYIETGQSPFLPGDLLLLCSDGLTDMVNREGIINLIGQTDTLSSIGRNLVAIANENGGRDNITVVLVQNHKAIKQTDGVRPELIKQPIPVSTDEEILIPKTRSTEKPIAKSNQSNFGFIALAILCVILLGTTILLFLQNRANKTDETTLVTPIKKVRNSQEQLLQDAFDHAVGDTLILSDSIFKSPIIISDTLHIKRDTLYVLAKGMILQADTAYKGIGLSIGAQSKITGLDSLQFKGFQTAISLRNTKLLLKNVSFNNCLLPVQNTYTFSNQPVTTEVYTTSPIVPIPVKTTTKKIN